MYFTKEFELKNREFISTNSDELNNIEQEDLDWFMVFHALTDYYENVIGFSSGGPLHIVLSDYNLEDNHIRSCIEDCKTIQDAVGLTLCRHLLEKAEDTRIFMIENEWFFRQYVEQVLSNLLHENLDNLWNPKKEVPVNAMDMTVMVQVEGLLKPSQQWLHSFTGDANWRVTFKGEPRLIPTPSWRFAYPANEKIEDYIVLSEMQSIKIL
jgi:hypothetical protein